VLLAGLWLVDAVETMDNFFDLFGWAGRTISRLDPTADARKDDKDAKDHKDRKDKKDLKDLKDLKNKV